jgi:hypothetical protein
MCATTSTIPSALGQSTAPANLIGRLADVGRHLLDLGTPLHALGPTLYDGLTGADTDDHARLFRTGLGLSAPLTRDPASDLAAEVERRLRGPKDYRFEKQFVLAHSLNNLVQAAHDGAEELRDEGVPVTAGNLETKILFAIANARPRSWFFPLGLTRFEVEEVILDAVAFFFRQEGRR